MCEITIDLTGQDVDAVYLKAKQEIEDHGSCEETGINALSFQVSIPLMGKIIGTLAIQNQQATVNVTHRPQLISCNRIEKQLKDYLSDN